MSEKVSRRSAIKALGVAGVALAAAPYLAKASAFQQLSGPQKSGSVVTATQPSAQQSSAQPLVLFVKGDQILGYRGLDEIPVQDASLAGMLNSRFNSKGATS
jgi:hypothetical protein